MESPKLSSEPFVEQRQKIYQSLCYTLSNRADQIAWDDFTRADWDLFAQMADREAIAPLMYWKLKDSPVQVPPSTFNLLRSTYYQTLAQNTLMYQELERILEALDAAGITVIVLKGAALAATVYEDIGLRPMGDLDLLVPKGNWRDARRIIGGLGYSEVRSGRTGNIEQWIAHEVKFESMSLRGITVELHHRLIAGKADRRSPAIEWFWDQTENFLAESSKHQCAALNTDAQLLYFAAHQAIQHENLQLRLIWLYDFYLVLRVNASHLDWQIIYLKAQKLGWQEALDYVLREIRQRFGVKLPEIYHETEPANSTFLHGQINSMGVTPAQTRSLRNFHKLRNLNWQAQFLFLLSIMFPSPTHMIKHYDLKLKLLLPLYYPYRWMDILIDIVRSLSGLTSRNSNLTGNGDLSGDG